MRRWMVRPVQLAGGVAWGIVTAVEEVWRGFLPGLLYERQWRRGWLDAA